MSFSQFGGRPSCHDGEHGQRRSSLTAASPRVSGLRHGQSQSAQYSAAKDRYSPPFCQIGPCPDALPAARRAGRVTDVLPANYPGRETGRGLFQEPRMNLSRVWTPERVAIVAEMYSSGADYEEMLKALNDIEAPQPVISASSIRDAARRWRIPRRGVDGGPIKCRQRGRVDQEMERQAARRSVTTDPILMTLEEATAYGRRYIPTAKTLADLNAYRAEQGLPLVAITRRKMVGMEIGTDASRLIGPESRGRGGA